MTLKILKTKRDYQAAMKRFEEIFQSKPGSKESDEADVLALLIKEYEGKHFVIAAPSDSPACVASRGAHNKV